MGERLSGDGAPIRHRHGHPDGTVSGPWDESDSAPLESVLSSALRTDRLDPEAEQRALTGFRAAAHDAGARRSRTRRRDDWRPREERGVRHPVRLTFGVVFASLTLGGVAVAAIGSAGSSADGAGTVRGTARPSAGAPDRPGGTPSPTPSGHPGPANRPSPAQDAEAHCRAYSQVEGHGKALDAPAWQRLIAAAGGPDKVAAYCSEHLTRAPAAPRGPAGAGKPGRGAANAGDGTAGSTGVPGNGMPGPHPGDPHNAPGNGQENGGKGSGRHE